MALDIAMVLTYSPTWISTLTLLFVMCKRRKKPRSSKIENLELKKTTEKSKPDKRGRKRKRRAFREVLLPTRSSTASRSTSEMSENVLPSTTCRLLQELYSTPKANSLEAKPFESIEPKMSSESCRKSNEELRRTRRHKFKQKRAKKMLSDFLDTAMEMSYSFRSNKDLQKTQKDSLSEKRKKNKPVCKMKRTAMNLRRHLSASSENDETAKDAPSLQKVETSMDSEFGLPHPISKGMYGRHKCPHRSMSLGSMLGPAPDEAPPEHISQQGDPDTYELVRRAELMKPFEALRETAPADRVDKKAKKFKESKDEIAVELQPLQKNINNKEFSQFLSDGALGTQSSIATTVDPPTFWFSRWKEVPHLIPSSISAPGTPKIMHSKEGIDGSIDGSSDVAFGVRETSLKEEPTMKSVREDPHESDHKKKTS